MARVRFAIPKGSLEDATIRFLMDAGYELAGFDRSYRPKINDPDIDLKVLRPQEIPYLIESGNHDIGITGIDWILESRADVEVLLNLEYGWVRLVLAVPKSFREVNTFEDLLKMKYESREPLRISTEYPNIAVQYIMENSLYRELYGESSPEVITPWWVKGENSKVKIFLSFGATEAKPPEDADAIIDVSSTGTTLERNNLKVIDSIMESTAVLIANKDALKSDKREKIYDIKALLEGVINARRRVHIFVNVKEENLNDLLKLLSGLRSPTVSPLAEEGWYSVNTVVTKEDFLRIMPEIRRLAQGLVVYRPKQILMLD